MPWFPELSTAVEFARLPGSDPEVAGTATIRDPAAGTVSGAAALQRFAEESGRFFSERNATVDLLAATMVPGRAVVEYVLNLDQDGARIDLPLAAVAASGESGMELRLYYSQWPLTGQHTVRPPLLTAGAEHPRDVVGRYASALSAGDTEAIVATFEPDGSFREPAGARFVHRGTDVLRSFYAGFFGAGGGIELQHCTVTDDGTRCALEYNCVRWGAHDLPPQAGVAVYERGADGLIAQARVYDDVQPPFEH